MTGFQHLQRAEQWGAVAQAEMEAAAAGPAVTDRVRAALTIAQLEYLAAIANLLYENRPQSAPPSTE